MYFQTELNHVQNFGLASKIAVFFKSSLYITSLVCGLDR